MKKFKSFLSFSLSQTAFVTCLYYGVFKGIGGFLNILNVFVWFIFILTLLSLFNKDASIALYKTNIDKDRFNLGPFSYILVLSYIGVMIFFGHILTGVIYGVTILLWYIMTQNGKKLMEEQQ
jgi:hypothetical protein